VKEQVISGIIITGLIIISLVASIFINNNLIRKTAEAHRLGYESGYAEGVVVGSREGSMAGYQKGSRVGYLESTGRRDDSDLAERLIFLYNPTYDQARQILAESEKTSTREINDYAEANGIRTAYVRCQIARGIDEGKVYVYKLVAFQSVDEGLIFVEPRSHQEVKIEVNRSYSELNSSPMPPYDDTITKITIVW